MRERGRPLSEIGPGAGGKTEDARLLVQSVMEGGACYGVAYGVNGGRGAPLAGRWGLAPQDGACRRPLCGPGRGLVLRARRAAGAGSD